MHALVEHLRYGSAVRGALGSSRYSPPSPGFMCGRGGTAYGSSCVRKSAVLAA
jgi:hypothetical protein